MRLRNLAVLCGLLAVAASHAKFYVITQLAPGADAKAVASTFGLSLIDTTEGAPFALMEAPTESIADSAESKMENDPRVVWAEDDESLTGPSGQRKGSTLPAVGDRVSEQIANRSALGQIGWNSSLSKMPGRSVRVALLDSGISPLAPALWSKVVANANFVELGRRAYDLPTKTDSDGDGIYDGLVGHGTMVAGVVDQVSPQSVFIVARIADSDGNSTTWRLIKGIAFAAVNGAELANVSLGTLSEIPAISDILDWANSKNLTVVAAIGNNGISRACYPAKVKKTICVGGLTSTNVKAPFSNWDSTCKASAPSVGICSTDWTGLMSYWSGTSFSTPMVTGALAEMLRQNRTILNSEKLASALKLSVVDITKQNPVYKSKLGGLLNVAKLVSLAKK